jgi:uncharacterized damage-inducible protein DinB
MNTTAIEIPQVISSENLLKHWQGHRTLTRRVIEMFPDDQFFSFSIGGMRTAAALATELLSIAAPALQTIVNRDAQPYAEPAHPLKTKEEFLALWDESTKSINENWPKLSVSDFGETFNLFGQYEFPIVENVLYFIDNEIHHRGQMYVYLRALNIEPPFFWERW